MRWPTGRSEPSFIRRSVERVGALPLRKRLLVSSLLGTIPLIILGIALLIGRYLSLRNIMLASNQNQAKLAAAYTQGWLEGQISTLRTIARSNEIQRGSLPEMRALAERQVKAQPDWDTLWITDAAGQEIVNTSGRIVNIADRPYFRQAKRTRRPVVSDIIVGRTTGYTIIAIAHPILHDSRFAGIVAVGMRPREVQKIFSHIEIGENMNIGLWGSDRRLIARTNTPERMLGRKYPVSDKKIISSGRSGTSVGVSPIDGQRVLIGYAPVKVAPWSVVASTPYYTALAPVTNTMVIFLILSSLVLVVTLVWSIYSANVIAAQVALLAASAKAIGEGNLATRVDLHTGGELADLAASLNKMAADLQVIDRLKSDLLSMVSHELKTPLTSIRTSLDLLASGTVTPDHPKYGELLEIADRQSRRLQDMIENLLSVARLEAGGLAVIPRPVKLRTIILTSMRQYEDIAHARGLQLHTEMPDDLSVQADAAKVTLALNNLLDNAIKFTNQGSVTIHVTKDDSFATVSVTDTGIGLTPEIRERLFEKFYQAEPLLTRKAGGTGLGLFVTRAIIEAHGGVVFATSEGPDRGSTFGFTLPLAL